MFDKMLMISRGKSSKPCLNRPKIAALTKQCAVTYCRSESTCFVSTIFADVFGAPAASYVATPPRDNAG